MRRWTYVVGLLLALLGTTTKAEHQVKGRLLLDVIVAEGAAILELLARENQALLVGRNAEGENNMNDRSRIIANVGTHPSLS